MQRYRFQLSSEDASTSSSLDLLLSNAADELGLHHNRSVDTTSAKELEHSVLCEVNHGSLCGVLHSLFLSLLREHVPQLVHIGSGAVVLITLQVKVSNTDLSEVSRVELIEKNTQMVQTSSLTTSRRMATMLANTTVSGTDMTSGLSVLALE